MIRYGNRDTIGRIGASSEGLAVAARALAGPGRGAVATGRPGGWSRHRPRRGTQSGARGMTAAWSGVGPTSCARCTISTRMPCGPTLSD